MTISKTCIANNISLLEPWGFLLIGHTASRRIKTADKHLQVLNLFTLLFYEVTEIIEKTARIAEFYWSKLQTSACIRELQLLLPITLSHLKFAHHKTTFSVSFKDVISWLFSYHYPTSLSISRRCWVFPNFLSPQFSMLPSILKRCIELMNMAYMVFQLLSPNFCLFPSIIPQLFRLPADYLYLVVPKHPRNIDLSLQDGVIFILAIA